MLVKLRILYFILYLTACNQHSPSIKEFPTNNDSNSFVGDETVKVFEARNFLAENQLQEARKIYLELIQNNNNSGYFDLGQYYIRKGDKAGVAILDSGAVKGNQQCAFELGVLYAIGKSKMLDNHFKVSIDYPLALNYFKIAAHSGYSTAQYNVAKMYHDSIYKMINTDSARYYLMMCIDNNSNDEDNMAKEAVLIYHDWFENK